MLVQLPKVIRDSPMIVVEHSLYLILIMLGAWGISPLNVHLNSNGVDAPFGVYMLTAQYTLCLLAGVSGQMSIVTGRIEHRIQTARFAFLTFASGGLMSLLVIMFGVAFLPNSLMLNICGMLVAGVAYLHLNMHLREGAYGRWSCSD